VIHAAAITAAAIAAADHASLDGLQRDLRELDPLALLRAPAAQGDQTHTLRRTIDRLRRRAERELEEIDASPDLYTDPALRQRRSGLAVTTLTLRLPIARARLTAFDPGSSDTDLAAAIDELNALAYAWGDAELERRAALAALHLRRGDHARVLEHAQRADPADPITAPARVAARAALRTLDAPPRNPDLLEHALFGAARAPNGPSAAADLAARALRQADAAALDQTRAVALGALAELARAENNQPPLARLALAETHERLSRLEIDSESDPLAAAERDLKRWTLDPSNASPLARAALHHPNPAAALDAAERLTPRLNDLDAETARPLLARLLALDPGHPHADHWRLAAGRLGDAAALDAITAPELVPAATRVAARLAREDFAAAPSDERARQLIRRCRAARVHTPEDDPWNAWLLDAEAHARLHLAGPLPAARWLASEPASPDAKRDAAARLLPPALEAAYAAERAGDDRAQRDAATIAASAANLAREPAARARALSLASDPDAARRALERAPAGAPGAAIARAEALFLAGRDADAFPLFREIAGSTSAPPGDAFWRAWSRMLQMLARRDEPGDADTIARQITRLRAKDPALGGDPHRRRIEALAND